MDTDLYLIIWSPINHSVWTPMAMVCNQEYLAVMMMSSLTFKEASFVRYLGCDEPGPVAQVNVVEDCQADGHESRQTPRIQTVHAEFEPLSSSVNGPGLCVAPEI